MEEGPARWPDEQSTASAPATWDDVMERPRSGVVVPALPPMLAPAWGQQAAVWEPRYAGWGRRAAGFVLDVVFAWTVPFALFIVFGLSLTPANVGPQNTHISPISYVLLSAWLVTGVVALVTYPVWFIGHRGRTPGMRLMRLRVYRVDGEMRFTDPSRKDAWKRCVTALGLLLAFAWGGFLDFFAPLWDRRNRCWHDNAAHTVVVDEREHSMPARSSATA